MLLFATFMVARVTWGGDEGNEDKEKLAAAVRCAGALRRFLGMNRVNGLSDITGFLLVCIGIQFVINGVRGLVLDTRFWQG